MRLVRFTDRHGKDIWVNPAFVTRIEVPVHVPKGQTVTAISFVDSWVEVLEKPEVVAERIAGKDGVIETP